VCNAVPPAGVRAGGDRPLSAANEPCSEASRVLSSITRA
jgi:hypothetical protein